MSKLNIVKGIKNIYAREVALNGIVNMSLEIGNKFERTNSGGCVFVSVAIYDWIKEKYPLVDVDFIYFLGCIPLYVHEENVRKNTGSSCAHCMLKITMFDKDYYIDSTGVMSYDDVPYYYKYGHVVSVTRDYALLSFNSESVSWNPTFNRKQTIYIARFLNLKYLEESVVVLRDCDR